QHSSLGGVVAAPFVPELERDVASATDFPVATTGFGFSYHFDPGSTFFVRSERTLGSTFIERPATIGQGLFDIRLTYFYAHFTESDGDSLEGLVEPVLFRTVGLLDLGKVRFQQFALTSQTIHVAATYGLLPDLDLSVLVPLQETSLKVRQIATSP